MNIQKRAMSLIIVGLFLGAGILPSISGIETEEVQGGNEIILSCQMDDTRFQEALHTLQSQADPSMNMVTGYDLAVIGIGLIWEEKEPGATVQVLGIITNYGSSRISRSFYIGMYLDGSHKGGDSWSGGLDPGQSLYINGGLRWPNDMLEHTVTIFADAHNSIPESNEGNNKKSMTDSIGDPPNTPPEPYGPSEGYPNTEYNYRIRGVSDPNGDDVKYYISWGDGTEEWTDYLSSGQSVSLTHQWSGEGRFMVKAKAQDEYGLESDWSDSRMVTIASNFPPETPNRPTGPASGRIKQEHQFTTSTTDPEGDQLWYKWSWGDGKESSWLGPFNSGQECDASHIWYDQEEFEIKVKAKDGSGEESDWSDPFVVTLPKSENVAQRLLSVLDEKWFLFSLVQRFFL